MLQNNEELKQANFILSIFDKKQAEKNKKNLKDFDEIAERFKKSLREKSFNDCFSQKIKNIFECL